MRNLRRGLILKTVKKQLQGPIPDKRLKDLLDPLVTEAAAIGLFKPKDTSTASVNQDGSLSLTFNAANLTAPGTLVTAGTVSITAPAGLFESAPPCTVGPSGTCTIIASISPTATPGVYTITASYTGTTTFASSPSIDLGPLTVRYPTSLVATTNPLTTSVSVNPGDVDALSLAFSVTTAGTTIDAGTVTIEATPAGLFKTPPETPSCTVGASGTCTIIASISPTAAPGVYTITATYAETSNYMSSTSGTLGTLIVRYPSTYQGIFNYCDSTTPTPICYLVVEVASDVPSALTPFSSTDKIEVKITPTGESATTTTLTLDYIKPITSGTSTTYVFGKLNSDYLSTTATYSSIVITPTSTLVNPVVKPFDEVNLTSVTGIVTKQVTLP